MKGIFVALALLLCLGLLPALAVACKSDYCNGMPPSPPPPPPPSGGPPPPPTATQTQQCLMEAKTNMTGAQLYSFMQSLPAAAQYGFYSTVAGSGGGQNDLNAVVVASMFGGDMTAYNTWVNNSFYNGGGGFNPADGSWTYNDPNTGLPVTGTLAGWSCPYYP